MIIALLVSLVLSARTFAADPIPVPAKPTVDGPVKVVFVTPIGSYMSQKGKDEVRTKALEKLTVEAGKEGYVALDPNILIVPACGYWCTITAQGTGLVKMPTK